MDILLVTYIDKQTTKPKLPHLHHLQQSNPEAKIHIVVSKDSGFGKQYDWKNADQPIRLWLKENMEKIESEQVCLIEWDTLVTKVIPELPEHLDLASKTCLFKKMDRPIAPLKRMRDPTWTSENWMWWREIPLLKLSEKDQAIGLISLGFYHTRKWVLEKLIDAKYDTVFKKNIISEMRFPTVAGLCGARVGEIDLPNVEFDDVVPSNIPGIYHGVNRLYESTSKSNC